MISVVVPTHNNADTLAETVRSILAQTAVDFELLVIDDGSTDDTVAAIADLVGSGRLRLLQQENRGISRTRNRGFAEAKGDLVAFVDADDLIRPDALAVALKTLKETPGARWCMTDVLRVRKDQERVIPTEWPVGEDPVHAILRDNFVARGFLFERTLLQEFGGYSEALQGREDWELFIRLFRAGVIAAYAREALYIYIERSDSYTRNFKAMAECWGKVLRLHHRALAAGGDPVFRRIYADQLWILSRFYRYQVGNWPKAMACGSESFRIAPRLGRIAQGLRSCWRLFAGSKG
jgi:glycosyltransferase involved in cell wall biosynthesis